MLNAFQHPPGNGRTGARRRLDPERVQDDSRGTVQSNKTAFANSHISGEFAAIAPKLRETAAQLQIELLEFVTADRTGWTTSLDRVVKASAEAFVPFAWFADSPVTGGMVIEFANRHRVPAVFADAESVERGGLISWGTNLADDVRRAADMLARVLKGAKPADLPVDQAARFELVVNLKTAKAIGLSIRQTVLLRADRVIE